MQGTIQHLASSDM